MAVGNSGAVLTSSDGANWLTQPLPGSGDVRFVSYGNGTFIAGQAEPGAPGSPSHMLTSTNGTNWVAGPFTVDSLAYGNGLYVGIATDVVASTNALTWTVIWRAPLGDNAPTAAAYGAGTYCVAFSAGGVLAFRPRETLGWSGQTSGASDLTLTGGWLGQQGRLQAASELSATDWTDLLTFTNQGPVTPLHDPYATNSTRRFYRVALPWCIRPTGRSCADVETRRFGPYRSTRSSPISGPRKSRRSRRWRVS